jgi:hypothetical protein
MRFTQGADPIQPTHINPANEVGGAALTADGGTTDRQRLLTDAPPGLPALPLARMCASSL